MPHARFALRDGSTGQRLARWRGMDGFFVGTATAEQWYDQTGEEPPEQLEISVEGLSADAALSSFRDEAEGDGVGDRVGDRVGDAVGSVFELGDILVDVLDVNGLSLGSYDLWGASLEVEEVGQGADGRGGREGGEARGRGTLWATVSVAPHASARAVWDRWREQLPDTYGQWTALPAGARDGWVEAAQLRYFHQAGERRTWPMPEDPITLHGEHIVDLASFFCAVGEAFNGPGGYFGSNFSALADCLANLNREPGELVQLRWTDVAVAEEALARRVETGDGWTQLFDIAMKIFDSYGVEVLRRG